MTDSPRGTGSGSRGTMGVAALAAVLLVIGVVVLFLGMRGNSGPPQPVAGPVASASAPAAPSPDAGAPTTQSSSGSAQPGTPPSTSATSLPRPSTTAGTGPDLGVFLPASAPTKLEIPSIGMASTTFVPLQIKPDGEIDVPGTEDEVGLYEGGPGPGQLGPSVLAAHVDSPSGRKGIFYNLGAVKVGDQVRIARADGSRLSFTVDRVQIFKKSEFPTDAVYKGDFTRAELRLVTCGGPTDSANEYRDNVIVFGHLTNVAS